MRRAITIVTLMLGLPACSVRTRHESELGREFALRLCAVQDACGCDDDVIIPDCEERVEHEFAQAERKSLAAGFVYDAACMEAFLERIDARGACGLEAIEHEHCAVYGGDRGVGEPCEVFEAMPLMYSCRFPLGCYEGVCQDLDRPRLPEGAICSADQHYLPTGDLGWCDDGLRCDSIDTRTCVPAPIIPQSPLGEACTHPLGCVDGNICRPQGDDPQPSEERPGVCVERTPAGEPCTLAYECELICEDGRCLEPPPPQPVLCYWLRDWLASREYF